MCRWVTLAPNMQAVTAGLSLWHALMEGRTQTSPIDRVTHNLLHLVSHVLQKITQGCSIKLNLYIKYCSGSDLPLWLFGRIAVDCFELAMLKEVSNVSVRLYSTRRRVWWSAHAWWLEESPPVWCFLPRLSYLVTQNWGHLGHEWEWPQGQKKKLTLFPADALPAHWPNWTFMLWSCGTCDFFV